MFLKLVLLHSDNAQFYILQSSTVKIRQQKFVIYEAINDICRSYGFKDVLVQFHIYISLRRNLLGSAYIHHIASIYTRCCHVFEGEHKKERGEK